MRATAELAARRSRLHDAYLVVVLLPEERDRPGGERLFERHRLGVDVLVGEDGVVHLVLDTLQLLRRERAVEREVEPEVRGVHERPRLMHVLAEEPAQRRVL